MLIYKDNIISVALLVIMTGTAACGSGGGGNGEQGYPDATKCEIDTSGEGANYSYTTNRRNVLVCGSGGPIMTFLGLGGLPTISWVNTTTGDNGTASIGVTGGGCSLILVCEFYYGWQARIPLAAGQNVIMVDNRRIDVLKDKNYLFPEQMLQVTKISPSNQATSVQREMEVELTFSAEPDWSTINPMTIRLVDSGGTEVAATLNPKVEPATGLKTIVVLKPITLLKAKETYTIIVAAAVKSPGRITTGEYRSSFTTGDFFSLKMIARYGTSGDDIAAGMAQDAQGNIYITGTSNGELFLLKSDANGNPLWRQTYGAIGGGRHRLDVNVSANGDIYLAGDFLDIVDGNSFQSFGLFVMKCDSAGSKVWSRIESNAFYVMGRSRINSAGEIYVVGTAKDCNSTGWPCQHMILTKYDGDGNVLWRRLSDTGSATGADIAVDKNDNVYISGDYGYVSKYDGSGNSIWSVSVGGGAGNKVAVGVSGGVNVAYPNGSVATVDADGKLVSVVPYGQYGPGVRVEEYSMDGLGNPYLLVSDEVNGRVGITSFSLSTETQALQTVWKGSMQCLERGYYYMVPGYDYYANCGFRMTVNASGTVNITGAFTGQLDGTSSLGGKDVFLMKSE